MWDSHAHPDLMISQEFEADVVNSLKKGVKGCLAAGTSTAQLEKLMLMCRSSSSVKLLEKDKHLSDISSLESDCFYVFPAFGVHPWFYPVKGEESLESYLEAFLSDIRVSFSVYAKKVWAVGEIGFDFAKSMELHYQQKNLTFEDAKKVQSVVCTELTQLAARENLPLIVHSRGAAAETIQFAQQAFAAGVPAIMYHSYPYSFEVAKRIIVVLGKLANDANL